MNEKRFKLHIIWYNKEKTEGEVQLTDNGQPLLITDDIVGVRLIKDCLNALHEENVKLQARNKYLATKIQRERNSYQKQHEKWENEIQKENEKLKSTIKEVTELLSDEVDLFSDKATEHDIIAYVELKELDNKDAYYMATATKKAIRMLKELQE